MESVMTQSLFPEADRPAPARDAAEARLLTALRLHLVDGVGPRMHQELLDHFGTVEAVFEATREELLGVDGVGPRLAASIIAARHSREPAQELQRCRERGLRLLVRGSDDYPPSLAEIHDPPSILYCRGEYRPQDQLAVAIVGSRRCTMYGRQVAEKLAGGLARAGLTVVSGLARGIDGAAHRGALDAGGRTLAVMGTGLGEIYPPEHADLADEIAQQGALLTENKLLQPPLPGLFPQRNRIISGMVLGVIVVEAARNSGALHTVRHAMEQGREVFAVPGRIDSLASAGCHDILRDGATLVRDVQDVLQALGPLMAPVVTATDQMILTPRELNLDDQERRVLNLVTIDPIAVDDVLRTAGFEASRVLATLTVLEMRRLVRRVPGGQVCRVL
jgi:DNA processing protein